MLCEISRRHLFYALLLGGISVVLSAAAANMIQHYYQVAANPRVAGRIERTWIVTGKHNSHTRVADVAFTESVTGEPIDCRAEGMDIGPEIFAAKAGDSVELSPIPGTCERPYVINIQPPTWLIWTLIGIFIGLGCLFAMFSSMAFYGRWPRSTVR
jgi:hypothetical protein